MAVETFRAKTFQWIFLCLLCWLGGWTGPPAQAMAQAKPPPFPQLSQKRIISSPQLEWKIEASQISYDQNRDTYEAWGGVRLTAENRMMMADWAELNGKRRQVELW